MSLLRPGHVRRLKHQSVHLVYTQPRDTGTSCASCVLSCLSQTLIFVTPSSFLPSASQQGSHFLLALHTKTRHSFVKAEGAMLSPRKVPVETTPKSSMHQGRPLTTPNTAGNNNRRPLPCLTIPRHPRPELPPITLVCHPHDVGVPSAAERH